MKTNLIKKPVSLFLKLPKPIKRINWVVFIYYLGWGMALPFIPLYLKEIFGDYSSVGLIMGLLYFFSIPWALFLGERLDRIHKKSIITFTLLLYLPFSFLFLALKEFWQFVILRAFHGGISTSFWATSEAYTRQHSSPSQSSLCIGAYQSSIYLSLALGGIFGGFLYHFFSYKIIYSISIFAFLAVLLANFLPNKEKLSSQKETLKGELKNFFKNKKLLSVALYACLLMLMIGLLDISLPIFTKKLGGTPFKIGAIYSLFYLPFFFQIYFVYPKNKKRLLFLSLLLAFFAFISMYFINSPKALLGISLGLGLAISSILPLVSGKITNLMNKRKIGEQNAVFYALKSLASGIAYFSSGFISDFWGIKMVFGLGALGVLLALIIAFKNNPLDIN